MKLKWHSCLAIITIFISIQCNSIGQSILNQKTVAPPFNLGSIQAQFVKDIPYDSDAKNKFDIFMPQSSTPTPVVIFIHGGGFTGGKKEDVYNKPAQIKALLLKGITVVSINYRLLKANDTDGVLKPLNDSKRCLQFIKHHAQILNIDKDSIALYGTSAGAGTSLYLAFHDDMADGGNSDPILRESTKVLAVAAVESQATYELKKWETQVFNDFSMTLNDIVSIIGQPQALRFYGISNMSDFYSPPIVMYRAEVDILKWMDATDPPMWLQNSNQPKTKPTTIAQLYHHPFHARELKEQADAVGLTNVTYIPKLGIVDASGQTVIQFLIKKLKP